MEKVSVVLPAHNEESRLEASLASLGDAVRAIFPDFEIIISEDGSSDRTVDIARRLSSGNVRLIHSDSRLGKGGAITKAALAATGDIILFMDVDLSSNIGHMRELVASVEGGSDIAVGSRYLPGSDTRRSPIRDIASRGFNLMVRLLLGSRISDHQCGFKSFRKSRVIGIMEDIENRDWFWDTELLVRAQRRGLKISEIPIEWHEASGSRFRLLEDAAHMAYSLARFKWKHG